MVAALRPPLLPEKLYVPLYEGDLDAFIEEVKASLAQITEKISQDRSLQKVSFDFDQLLFLQDFLTAKFKAGQNALALNQKLIDMVKEKYPQAQAVYPDWTPHISLYKPPKEGIPADIKQKLVKELKQPQKIKPFTTTIKGKLFVSADDLTKFITNEKVLESKFKRFEK